MNIPVKPVILSLIFLAAMATFFQGTENSDFLAVYLAGISFSNGQFDQIYPALNPVFDLSYPDSWKALALAQGIPETSTLYPFIYPPLWAVLASWGAPFISISKLSFWLPLVNSTLLLGCSWMGWRITRSTVPVTLWLSVGFLTMATTTYGYVALAQGQPQILISFLILLAIERSRAGAPLTAGGCLALAASIKLYPLLLVVLWVARKDWRAVASFAVFGGAAALASIWLAGWPLHQTFLAQIGVISNSVLVTPLSYNFTALVTALTQDVFAAPQPFSGQTPSVLLMINKLALFATLVLAGIYAMRATPQKLYNSVWPLLLIAVSFFSPMSWSYHFLTALAFAPLVFGNVRIGPKLCILFLFVASSIFLAIAIGNNDLSKMILFSAGLTSLAALTVSFMFAKPKPSDQS